MWVDRSDVKVIGSPILPVGYRVVGDVQLGQDNRKFNESIDL